MRISTAGSPAEAARLHPHRSSRFSVSVSLGAFALLAMIMTLGLSAHAKPAQAKPKEPTVNAGAGSCSADFLIQGRDHKPLYGAQINVKFQYGLFGLHKVSLGATTGVAGTARFKGLPRQPRNNAYLFHIRHGDLHKKITDSPLDTCQAQFTVVLQ